MRQYKRTLHSLDPEAPDASYAMTILNILNASFDRISENLKILNLRHWNKNYQEKQSKILAVDQHLNI